MTSTIELKSPASSSSSRNNGDRSSAAFSEEGLADLSKDQLLSKIFYLQSRVSDLERTKVYPVAVKTELLDPDEIGSAATPINTQTNSKKILVNGQTPPPEAKFADLNLAEIKLSSSKTATIQRNSSQQTTNLLLLTNGSLLPDDPELVENPSGQQGQQISTTSKDFVVVADPPKNSTTKKRNEPITSITTDSSAKQQLDDSKMNVDSPNAKILNLPPIFPDEKFRQQQLEAARRENVLVMRLTTKEQEVQEYLAQLEELRTGITNGGHIKNTLLDPAVNIMFQRMKKELEETKEKLHLSEQEFDAWKFTPDSTTGKRLMAKCRMLIQENDELGKLTSSGRIAKLEGDLAMSRKLCDDLKNSQTDIDAFLLELDESMEGMQSTAMGLQQRLDQAVDENSRLKRQLADAGVSSLVGDPVASNSRDNGNNMNDESSSGGKIIDKPESDERTTTTKSSNAETHQRHQNPTTGNQQNRSRNNEIIDESSTKGDDSSSMKIDESSLAKGESSSTAKAEGDVASNKKRRIFDASNSSQQFSTTVMMKQARTCPDNIELCSNNRNICSSSSNNNNNCDKIYSNSNNNNNNDIKPQQRQQHREIRTSIGSSCSSDIDVIIFTTTDQNDHQEEDSETLYAAPNSPISPKTPESVEN